MKKRLLIVGAGGFGRELHSWVKLSPQWTANLGVDEVAFLDDQVPAISVDAEILGGVGGFEFEETDVALVAIGSPATRRSVTELLHERGATLGTFVADGAIIGDRVRLGPGVVICPGVVITSDIEIGDHAHININCTVGHDVRIGEYVTLSPACNLTGGVVVSNDAFLGTAVTVVPDLTIGAGSYIGAGSIVVKNVPPKTKAFGNPARAIGPA